MTRQEHLKWCKDRAIQEYDFYFAQGGSTMATRNGLTSMMSDMGKHDETKSNSLNALILMNMRTPMIRQKFVEFINGFN